MQKLLPMLGVCKQIFNAIQYNMTFPLHLGYILAAMLKYCNI